MAKNEKICIIGAGPAGLSAAVHLEKNGYTDYSILEKEDHVGGKCHSPYHDGKRFEMGAIMGCPTYYAVHELELFGGVDHNGPKLERAYRKMNGKPYDPFNPKKNPLLIPHLLKMKSQVKKLGTLLATKYKGYQYTGHKGISEGKYDGYDPVTGEHVVGENPNLKDLCMNFKDFCKLNKVELAQEIWIGPYTAFGYGFFDEIPAAYVMKYLDFATAMYFVNKDLWTWKDGTQSIYEAVNEKLQHPARLNVNITKVTRENGKVQVYIGDEMEEYDNHRHRSPAISAVLLRRDRTGKSAFRKNRLRTLRRHRNHLQERHLLPRYVGLSLRQHGSRKTRSPYGVLSQMEGRTQSGSYNLRPAQLQG